MIQATSSVKVTLIFMRGRIKLSQGLLIVFTIQLKELLLTINTWIIGKLALCYFNELSYA